MSLFNHFFSSNFPSLLSVMRYNSSVPFHLKLYMLWTKKAHQSVIFQTEGSPNSPCHFWNHKVKIYSILHHCSVSWKITPLHFFSSNLYHVDKKSPLKLNFWLWVVGWKFTKFLCHVWNYKSVFLETLHHISVLWEITLLYFISWSGTWFGEKKPIKVQNFRLSTTHVKFH